MLVAVIVTGGSCIATIGWKLLDVGKRAVELERDRRRDGDGMPP